MADIYDLFPNESDEKIIAFMEKIKELTVYIPDDKIGYLEELFAYVDGLINGDEIHQYCSYNGVLSKYAKEAFQKIAKAFYERKLATLKREKQELETTVGKLSDQKTVLNKEVDSLENKRQELAQEAEHIGVKVSNLIKELEEKKENGIKEVENAVADESKQLQETISNLSQEKEHLMSTIAELKNLLSVYNNIIARLPESQVWTVSWVPIAYNDPIYDTNHYSAGHYVNQLQETYQKRMGVTKEQCEIDFKQNCPFLNDFLKIMQDYFTNPIPACVSVRTIINSNNWDEEGQKIVSKLNNILKTLKLPTYQSIKTNIGPNIELGKIPTNMEDMLRELHFQRMVIEAVTQKRILEAEVKSLVKILMEIAPKDYDFRSLMETYQEFDSVLPSEMNHYLDHGSKSK